MDFYRVMSEFAAKSRAAQKAEDAKGAQELLTRCIISVGRFPTMGEVLTFLARRRAALSIVETALSDASYQRYAELTVNALTAFCTEERLAQLDDHARTQAQKALELSVDRFVSNSKRMGSEWPFKRFENALMDMDDDTEKDHYNDWRRLMNEEVSKRNIRELNETLVPVVRAAKLPKLDEERLLAAIDEQVKGSLQAYTSFFSEDGRALRQLMESHEFDTKELHLSGTKAELTFSEVVEKLKEEPTLEVTTSGEHNFYSEGPLHFAYMLARDDAEASSFYVLMGGELYDLADKNPFVREAAFRFVVDELGLDPRTEAAFVARREVVMGGNRRDGHYFLYPLPAKNLTVAIGKGKNGDPRAHIWVFRGDLEFAKNALAEATSPSFEEGHAEARRQRKVLAEADASVDRNAFKGMYLDFSKIDEQFDLRAHVQQELAKI